MITYCIDHCVRQDGAVRVDVNAPKKKKEQEELQHTKERLCCETLASTAVRDQVEKNLSANEASKERSKKE